MRKFIFSLAAFFATILSMQQVKAQTGASASVSVNATATIVKIISIEKTADLDFGTFASTSSYGIISIETFGYRYVWGGIIPLNTNRGNPATFTAHGTANGYYSVTLPADNSVTLTLSGSSETMTIYYFTHDAIGIFDATGQETFNVGGVLYVPANQPAGTYTGTFDVTVAHQ